MLRPIDGRKLFPTRVSIARTTLLVALMWSALAVRAQPLPSQQQPQDVVIRGGWLFDGVGDARIRNTGIVVRGGKFIEVGVELKGRDLSRARVLDLDDAATVLPGMFDLHAHYNMSLGGEGRIEEATYNPIVFLANGATSTFPAGEYFPDRMIEARDAIDSGKRIGPRIFTSGPYFGAARCPGTRTHRDECAEWPNAITEPQIRQDVDRWARRGVRSLKVKLASPEEMRIVIDQAHKYGITVTTHSHNYEWVQDVQQKDAILMGLDRIEHTIVPMEHVFKGEWGPGTPQFKELVDLMLKHNVYFDATMSVYGRGTIRSTTKLASSWTDEGLYFTPFMQEQFKKRSGRFGGNSDYAIIFKHKVPELKAFYDAGGSRLITVGTDRPTGGPELAGFEIHRELQAIVHAGLPPIAALKAATINGARALGVGDQLGSIEPGKLSDLFVVSGNPLQTIEDARRVRWVMKSGLLYDVAELLKSLEGRIGPTGSDDLKKWQRTP